MTVKFSFNTFFSILIPIKSSLNIVKPKSHFVHCCYVVTVAEYKPDTPCYQDIIIFEGLDEMLLQQATRPINFLNEFVLSIPNK